MLRTMLAVGTCGPFKESHVFATDEESASCSVCNADMCTICVADLEQLDGVEGSFCLPCLGNTMGAEDEERIAVKRMRAELLANNAKNVSDFESTIELEAFYDAVVNGKIEGVHGTSGVRLQIRPSRDLSDNEAIDRRFPFEFDNGAQFLRAG